MNDLLNELKVVSRNIIALQGDLAVETAQSVVDPDADPRYVHELLEHAINMLPGQLENIIEKAEAQTSKKRNITLEHLTGNHIKDILCRLMEGVESTLKQETRPLDQKTYNEIHDTWTDCLKLFNPTDYQWSPPIEAPTASWFLCQFDSGQYADGYYGTNSRVLDEEQIFRHDQLPYMPCKEYRYIFVGSGEKPGLQEVQKILYGEKS